MHVVYMWCGPLRIAIVLGTCSVHIGGLMHVVYMWCGPLRVAIVLGE